MNCKRRVSIFLIIHNSFYIWAMGKIADKKKNQIFYIVLNSLKRLKGFTLVQLVSIMTVAVLPKRGVEILNDLDCSKFTFDHALDSML